ncbi:MAG: hypothetical protein JWP91_553 [Fibrobacteres bacterium]|nr:hypothetical protein [Fibrobacterota bacterium]
MLMGCDGSGSATGPGRQTDEGPWITDSVYTLDEFPFGSDACLEVFPAGSVNSETRGPDAAAALRIIATACYHARVTVIDSAKDTVRTFDSRFGIFNRTEEEKNRGVVGYVSWDGKDDLGIPVPRGRYLWRMDFDFGSGRTRRFRAEFVLP